ncbi:MAG: FAD-dependent oxidoreductase, partial [Rhodothermales bacterium]|nr:FAD-dependent oxidoreductase [Rhodothermales bacterium]
MRESQAIAVIGGTAAGTAAAAEIKRLDPNARVVLFEKGPHIAYGACEIPQLIQGGKAVSELIRFTPEEFQTEKGVLVRPRTMVTQLRPSSNRLHATDVESGSEWEERFDKFVVATGARAAVPQVEGVDSLNTFAVRTLRDASALRRASLAYPSSHVVVVGGGYVGVEIGEALLKNGHRVTILTPGGRLLTGYLDPIYQDRITAQATGVGVTIRDERLASVIVDPANRVQAVQTAEGERIGCKIVVLATGIVPEVSLAVSAGARIGRTGALRVSDSMRTSVANVWACGDCVEVNRVVDGRPVHVALSPTAY